MDLRDMKKYIWGAIYTGLSSPRKTVEDELEATKQLIFKFKTPSEAVQKRWDQALWEVQSNIAVHAGIAD